MTQSLLGSSDTDVKSELQPRSPQPAEALSGNQPSDGVCTKEKEKTGYGGLDFPDDEEKKIVNPDA